MKNVVKLGLGTVQWGGAYGITNQSGKTPPKTVSEILVAAQGVGVTVLDTASLYGNSETVLGSNSLQAFCVVTKTPRFALPEIGEPHVRQLIEAFEQSLIRLKLKSTYGLLAHHAEDILAAGGDELVAAMMNLKEQGKVRKIGVSVYDGSQIEGVLKRFKPDLVQVPVSVLDQRLLLNGQLELLKKEGVEIHVRSVFLQGLLLMPLEQLPGYFDPVRPLLTRWHAAAREQGMSLTQAALCWARDIPHVDTVLVGVESLAQFHSCIDDFSTKAAFDARGLSCDDPLFVNPALWRLS